MDGRPSPAMTGVGSVRQYFRPLVLYRDYTFAHDWELLPGVWTFQIWYQGRMLAEEKFTVVKQ